MYTRKCHHNFVPNHPHHQIHIVSHCQELALHSVQEPDFLLITITPLATLNHVNKMPFELWYFTLCLLQARASVVLEL